VIATTASLVIKPDINRAIIPLLIESAREELYQGGLLAGPEEFPSAYGVEAPLADEALRYFEQGPSFFYRWLPFRYAYAATRLSIVLLPLLTLLYPLLRSAGPTYRWFNQRRVYRWYRVLQSVEAEMDSSADAANLKKIGKKLESVDDETFAGFKSEVGKAKAVFVAAGLEYALRNLPIRETAFFGGYAPLIFHPQKWSLDQPGE